MNIFEKAVQGQLDSYNKHDLDGFLAWYTEDVMAIDIDTDKILFASKEEMRPIYLEKFKNQYLHCELKNRMSLNRSIIDHERITLTENNDKLEAIAIYDVNEDGLINIIRFTKGRV